MEFKMKSTLVFITLLSVLIFSFYKGFFFADKSVFKNNIVSLKSIESRGDLELDSKAKLEIIKCNYQIGISYQLLRS